MFNWEDFIEIINKLLCGADLAFPVVITRLICFDIENCKTDVFFHCSIVGWSVEEQQLFVIFPNVNDFVVSRS